MERSKQIALVRQMLGCLDRRSTAMADGVHLEPVLAYASPERAAVERQRLFREHPVVLALSGEIAKPGDFLTHDWAGVPIALVRAPSGRVHAFLNVCRHRGARVMSGSGGGRLSFACPYHAWTYDCEGRLLGMGTTRGFEDVAPCSRGLAPLPVVERHGLIWVRPEPGGPFDADALLGGMGPEIAGFGWAGYSHHETRILRRRMNWKLAVDTFLETWHVPVLHRRTVARVLHGRVGIFDSFGSNLRLVVPLRSIDALRQKPESDWDLVAHALIVHVVFPNTVLLMATDHLETWRIFPDGERPDASVLEVSLYTREPAVTEEAREDWDRRFALLLGTVNGEDFPVAEDIQRGLTAGAQEHFTFGRHEPALAHFHRAIDQALGIASAEPAPPVAHPATVPGIDQAPGPAIFHAAADGAPTAPR